MNLGHVHVIWSNGVIYKMSSKRVSARYLEISNEFEHLRKCKTHFSVIFIHFAFIIWFQMNGWMVWFGLTGSIVLFLLHSIIPSILLIVLHKHALIATLTCNNFEAKGWQQKICCCWRLIENETLKILKQLCNRCRILKTHNWCENVF